MDYGLSARGKSQIGVTYMSGYLRLIIPVFFYLLYRRPQMSQKMMRLRIAAQGFTVVGLMVGVGVSAAKSNM